MNKNFSFIILTYNEEIHLSRLLDSIFDLNAPTFVLDSHSTDQTVAIAKIYNASVSYHKFENHPKQWDFALKNIKVTTPWIIGLDADQVVSPSLFKLLADFKDDHFSNINGIFFNRKNYFQEKWIRFGGYYPFYMLKMFRATAGYSDLSENMDHRFVVSGKTLIWKKGHLLEENLKENDLNFWKKKHERYSDLLAMEELHRKREIPKQTIHPSLSGNPDEIRIWYKKIWRRLPLGIRPYLYFAYRIVFKLGILDGITGIKFHYLQGLWFRQLVDKKIKQGRKKMI